VLFDAAGGKAPNGMPPEVSVGPDWTDGSAGGFGRE
jgi:hypothetical protein